MPASVHPILLNQCGEHSCDNIAIYPVAEAGNQAAMQQWSQGGAWRCVRLLFPRELSCLPARAPYLQLALTIAPHDSPRCSCPVAVPLLAADPDRRLRPGRHQRHQRPDRRLPAAPAGACKLPLSLHGEAHLPSRTFLKRPPSLPHRAGLRPVLNAKRTSPGVPDSVLLALLAKAAPALVSGKQLLAGASAPWAAVPPWCRSRGSWSRRFE